MTSDHGILRTVGARMLRAPMRRFRKGSLAHNVLVLACGTGSAQALTIIAMPLLTRIFTPEAYGIVGLFVSIGALLSIAGTLHYEQAIPLEQNDRDAADMASLGLFWSTVVAALVFTVGTVLSLVLGNPGIFDVYDTIALAGLLSLALAIRLILVMWAVYRDRFGRIATTEFAQAGVMLVVQLGGGLLGLGALALVGGQLVGAIVGAALLVGWAWRDGAFDRLLDLDVSRTWRLARKHYRFPLYATPTALLDRFSKRAPLFLLAMFFSPLEAGYYYLCFRALIQPGRVVVANIRKPYYKRAADMHARGEALAPLLIKVTLLLSAVAAPLAVVLTVFGPEIFRLVFGAEWYRAGEYAQWLVFATATSILTIPCIQLAPLLDRQGQVLVLQVIHAALRTAAILIGALLGDDLLAIQLYSVASILVNITLIGYFWAIAGAAPKALRGRLPA